MSVDFLVELYPSNVQYRATAEHTLLDAALGQKLCLQHSCKKSQCGVCVAEVLSGSVKNEHGEVVCDGRVLTCSSYAQSDVRLKAEYYPQLAHLECVTVPCKVASQTWVVDDILLLTLRFPPTLKLHYLPGQYIDLLYQGVRRSYSIANAQEVSSGIELHIRLLPDGELSQLLRACELNQLMRLEGPKGTFFVREAENPLLFLAGGTGFAPVKAMVESLLAQGVSREIYIYWGMPNSRSLYTDIAERWSLEHPQVHYVPVVSQDDPLWDGRSGFVHDAVLADFADLSDFHVYACGSPLMIEAAKATFMAQGLYEGHFYSDAFVSTL